MPATDAFPSEPAAFVLGELQQAVRSGNADAFAAACRFPLRSGADTSLVRDRLFPLLTEPGPLRRRFLDATGADLAGGADARAHAGARRWHLRRRGRGRDGLRAQ
jgi:hypothetical protein